MLSLKKIDYKKNLNYIVLLLLGILLIAALIFTSLFLSDSKKNLDTNTKAATGPEYSLTFTPSNISPSINQEFAVALDLTTLNTVNIQGYQVSFTFDQTRLQLTNLDYTIGNPSIGLATDNTNLAQVNSSNTPYSGKIRLFAEIQSPNGYPLSAGVTKNLASLKFKYINSGVAQVALVDTKSEFDEIQTNGNLNPVKPVLQKVLVVGTTTTTTQIYVPNSVTPTFTTAPTNIASTNTPKVTTKPGTTTASTPVATSNPIVTPSITEQDSPTQIIETLTPFTYTPVPTTAAVSKNIASPVEILIWILMSGITIILITLGTVILIKRGKKI